MNPSGPTVATRTRERVFRRSFGPQPRSARLLRDALRRYLTGIDVEEATAARLLLCADEALVNAITHATRTPVCIAARVRDERLVLEVSDEGPGFDPGESRRDGPPDLDAEHGRGLFLIRRLMDHVQIDSSEHGTTIHMEWRLSPTMLPLAA